ncbi:hypothetical protein QR680_010848 [Steinernema hermaphroditum]|uniref:Uncharacterized protein n=1 Tax=Steinernema hermaphroditum TaxID=289476 RepID=A0AA39MCH6_9BILA|nr:hypothetical protein QR680_010848 [Steinernema hermaphroditum]
MLWAAIMSIDERTIGHTYLLDMTTAASYYQCLYFMAYFLFSLLLAINRMLVIQEWNIVPDMVYKCLILAAWTIILIVFPVLFSHSGYEFASEYDVDFAMYVSLGFMVEKVVQNIELPLYVAILLTYTVVILFLVFKRKSINQKLKMSSPEGRLALQSVLLFVPQGLAFLAMKVLQSKHSTLMTAIVFNFPRQVAIINILHDLLPFFYMATLISFNSEIRNLFICQCGSRKVIHIRVSSIHTAVSGSK